MRSSRTSMLGAGARSAARCALALVIGGCGAHSGCGADQHELLGTTQDGGARLEPDGAGGAYHAAKPDAGRDSGRPDQPGGQSGAGGDGTLADAGPIADAGPVAMDAGLPGAPVVTLVSPQDEAEVYRGINVRFEAHCAALGSAAIVSRRWLEVGNAKWSKASDAVDRTFDELGAHELDYVCENGNGDSTRVHVHVRVVDPPLLVYGDQGRVLALHVDDPDRSDELFAGDDYHHTVVDNAQYALGGKVVITNAHLAEDSSLVRLDAIYLEQAPDVQRHELLADTQGSGLYGSAVRISPDGRWVMRLSTSDLLIYRLDATGPSPLPPVPGLVAGIPFWFSAFSPDGRYLAYAGPGGALALLDLEGDGTPVAVVPAGGAPRGGVLSGQFSADSAHFVYMTGSRDRHGLVSGTRVFTVATAAAAAGETSVELLDPASNANMIAYPRVLDRTIWTWVQIGGSFSKVMVFDFAGAQVASLDTNPGLAIFCKHAALLTNSDGASIVVHDTASGLETIALDLPQPITPTLRIGPDCGAAAYETNDRVYAFALPPPGGQPADLDVQQIESATLWDIVSTARGDYVITADYEGHAQLRLGAEPPIAIASPNTFGLTPDGATLLTLEPATEYDLPPERNLYATSLVGPNASTRTLLAGPLQAEDKLVLSPDGSHALLRVAGTLSTDGQIAEHDGLIDIDFTNPSAPVTRALLPERTSLVRTQPRVTPIPKQHAVLIEAAGPVPCTSRIYARALGAGAQTIEQLSQPPYACQRAPASIEPSGAAFAVHRSLRDDLDTITTQTLRTKVNASGNTFSYDSQPTTQIVDFGGGDHRLVLLDGGPSPSLFRRDLAMGLSEPIIGPLAGGTIEVVYVQPKTGRVFFLVTNAAGDRRVLYAQDAGDIAPRALTAADRYVDVVEVAASGEWLALRLARAVSNEPVRVLDQRDDWEPHKLDVPDIAYQIELAESKRGDTLVLSAWPVDTVVYAFAREHLDERRDSDPQVGCRSPVLITHDAMRALCYGFSVPDDEYSVYAYDLTSAAFAPKRLAPVAFVDTNYTAQDLSADDRYLIVRHPDGGEVRLLDLESGEGPRSLGAATSISFDRRGGLLTYVICANSGACDLNVLPLAKGSEPIVVGFDHEPVAPTWVD